MNSNNFTVKVEGKEVKLKTIKVNNQIKADSQRYYAASLRDSIDKGILLKIELERKLDERGLLNTDKEEEKIKELRQSLRDLEVRLRRRRNLDGSTMSKEQGRAVALEMRKQRDEIGQVGQEILSLYGNSAESIAANEQNLYIIYATTVYAESGLPFFKDFQEFKDLEGTDPIRQAVISSFLKLNGADIEAEKQYYENKWLIQMKFMDEQLRFINDKGKLVDSEGRLVNEDGRYINENGDFVDIYGNPIDKDGNLLIEDAWSAPSNS